MEPHSSAFPQFTLLPVELRLAIWFYCLPHRVVQRDDPFMLHGLREKHNCWSIRPSLENAAPPRIASVCRESRQVAMRWGKMVSQDYDWNLGPIWFQPRLDSYHLDFAPEAGSDYVWDVEMARQPLTEGQCWLDEVSLSLPAKYFLPFALEMDDLSMLRYTPRIEIKEDLVDEDLKMVYNEYAYNYPRPFTKVSLSATMAFISIHVKREHAVTSGLFGLLLDAPVQLVDFDDVEKIRSFRALFERNHSNRKRTEIIKLFSIILSPTFRSRVQAWREKVDWFMMANAWLRAKMDWENCIPFDGDPMSAWNPVIEEFPDHQKIVYMKHERKNYENPFEDHNPWVIQAKKELPRVAPKVRFILCTNDCDVEGNLEMLPSVEHGRTEYL